MNNGDKKVMSFRIRKDNAKTLLWWVIAFLVVLPLACAVAAHGQEERDFVVLTSSVLTGVGGVEEESAVELTGELGFWSQYVGETGGVYHDRPVLQTELIAAFRSGLYVGAWASRTDGPYRETWGDEVDVFVGFEPNDNLDVGVMYILAPKDELSDWGSAYLKLSTPPLLEKGWSLVGFLKADYYWPLESLTEAEGAYNFRIGGQFSQEWERWSSAQRLEVLYDTGTFGSEEGYLWTAVAEVARQLGRLQVGFGVKYSRGINLEEDDWRAGGEVAFGTFIRF